MGVVYECGGVVHWRSNLVADICETVGLEGGGSIDEVYFYPARYFPTVPPESADASYWHELTGDLNDGELARIIPELGRLTTPFKLTASGVSISDEGLRDLSTVKALETLDLSGTRIGDAGVAHLRHMRSLRKLYLGDTLVTDRAIEDLASLQLIELDVSFTGITKVGLRKLELSMPNCEVFARGFGLVLKRSESDQN